MAIDLDLTKKEEERRARVTDEYDTSDDVSERRIQRLKIMDSCERNAEARALTWNLCRREDNPAEGCIFFIENFGWTYNPRQVNIGKSAHVPFILFEYQKRAIREYIDHIDNGRDLLVEKSRDMGVTWLTVWIFLWYWLFKDGTNLLMGSYKEALVDNRSDDSMFGRLDYSIDSLPKWMLPKGFNKKKHRTKLKLTNPVNYNLISGDTMNPDFGRGSRKTAIFFDELGSWDYAKDAWESCGDVTNCRIANSTPKGYNFYAKLRHSGIDVLTFHWQEHPFKDQEWYDYECSRRSSEEVAQEIDISYNKSQEGRVYPEWNDENVGYGLVEYDPGSPLYVGWDFGKTDETAIIWSQKKDGKLRIIDSYSRSGKNIDFFVPFVTGMVPSDSYNYSQSDLEKISSHRDWKRGTHFGDPAGRNKNNVTDATVLSILKDHGIIVNYRTDWQPHPKRRRAAKTLIMGGIEMNKIESVEEFNMCMENAAYPRVKVEGTDEVRSQKPKHDWTSHYRSAFEYLALGLEEFGFKRNQVYDKFKTGSPYTQSRRKGLRTIGY